MGGFSDSACWILQRLADFTVRGHINIFNTFPFVTASPRLLFWPRFTGWGKKDDYRTDHFVNLSNLQQAPRCNLTSEVIVEVVRFGVNNVLFPGWRMGLMHLFSQWNSQLPVITCVLEIYHRRALVLKIFCPNRQRYFLQGIGHPRWK